MTITKKMALFATAAIAALALAGPASASAADWVTPELSKTVKTSYSGSIKFSLAEGSETLVSVTCEAEADVTLKPGDSGSLDRLHLQSCVGGEAFEECNITSVSEVWGKIQAKSAAIELKSFFEPSFESKNCYLSGFPWGFENVKLTPDDAGAISTLAVTGNTSYAEELQAEVSGSLKASQSGAYGIGVGDRWIVTDPEPLAKPASVEVDGNLDWTLGSWGSGIECTDVHGTATLLPGGEAEVGEFDIDPASCSGHGQGYNNCKVEDAYAGSLGSVQATNDGSVRFDELWLTQVGIHGCEWLEPWYASVWGEVEATPDNPSQISKLNISELVYVETGYGLAWGGVMTGSLNIIPAGKYGISS